jgi:hypothetical protein
MAEYAYNPVQVVEPNQNVILDTVIPCNKGYVFHRDQSGIVILRGIVNCPNACFARYQVTFNGNIALPDGATVGPISLALAIDGEPVQTSRAIVTPAATADDPPTAANFFNVTSTAIINVPRGCCFTVAVENTSTPAVVGGTAPEILVQNANLTVSRIA